MSQAPQNLDVKLHVESMAALFNENNRLAAGIKMLQQHIVKLEEEVKELKDAQIPTTVVEVASKRGRKRQ